MLYYTNRLHQNTYEKPKLNTLGIFGNCMAVKADGSCTLPVICGKGGLPALFKLYVGCCVHAEVKR